MTFEPEGLDTRTVRLTTHASNLGDFAMSPDGKALYYLASFEDNFDLWKQDFQERSTTLVAKLGAGAATMQMSEDGGMCVGPPVEFETTKRAFLDVRLPSTAVQGE